MVFLSSFLLPVALCPDMMPKCFSECSCTAGVGDGACCWHWLRPAGLRGLLSLCQELVSQCYDKLIELQGIIKSMKSIFPMFQQQKEEGTLFHNSSFFKFLQKKDFILLSFHQFDLFQIKSTTDMTIHLFTRVNLSVHSSALTFCFRWGIYFLKQISGCLPFLLFSSFCGAAPKETVRNVPPEI